MFNKKIFLLTIILIAILSISVVSAEDSADSLESVDDLAVDESIGEVSLDEDANVELDEDNEDFSGGNLESDICEDFSGVNLESNMGEDFSGVNLESDMGEDFSGVNFESLDMSDDENLIDEGNSKNKKLLSSGSDSYTIEEINSPEVWLLSSNSENAYIINYISKYSNSKVKFYVCLSHIFKEKYMGTINLVLNGKVYTANLYGGEATIVAKTPAKVGSYKATLKYKGYTVISGSSGYKYNPSSTTFTLNVKKCPTVVSAPKVTAKYKKSKYFKVKVKNKITKRLVKHLKLKVKVYTGKKYKTYRIKTNSKGIAKLNTKRLSVGKHKVVIRSGNKNYIVKKTSKIIIKKAKAKKLAKGQYIDWCHGGEHDHKTVWTKKYYGKSYVGTVKINGVYYKKYVKLYQLDCKCKKKKYHKNWLKAHGQNYYSYQTITATNSPKYVYKKAKFKTVTLGTKYDNYVTKYSGKYAVETYKWKGYSVGGLEIYLYKNGKMVPSSKYSSKAYYNADGTWRWSSWSHASEGYTNYHHYALSNDVKIGKVKVKFMT